MTKPDRIDNFIRDVRNGTTNFDASSYGIWGRIDLIRELHHHLISQSIRHLDLTFNEWQIIGVLLLSGPPYEMNPRQLIQAKIMSSGGITNLLGKMEASGLIVRKASNQGRRGVLVTLTPDGLKKARTSLEGNFEMEMLSGLNTEEIEIFNILLRKLLSMLDALTLDKSRD
jgi:DNA-binding MarR family transcriptional regulator